MSLEPVVEPRRIKRKPPPPFPYSARYPEPDPNDPFAPLSVLRKRTSSMSPLSNSYNHPVALPSPPMSSSPASASTRDLAAFVERQRNRSAFDFPLGDSHWQGYSFQLRQGSSLGLHEYASDQEATGSSNGVRDHRRPGATNLQRHESRRRSQSVFALRPGTFSFIGPKSSPPSQHGSETKRSSSPASSTHLESPRLPYLSSPFSSSASALSSSSSSGSDRDRKSKSKKVLVGGTRRSSRDSFTSAYASDYDKDRMVSIAGIRQTMHILPVDMPSRVTSPEPFADGHDVLTAPSYHTLAVPSSPEVEPPRLKRHKRPHSVPAVHSLSGDAIVAPVPRPPPAPRDTSSPSYAASIPLPPSPLPSSPPPVYKVTHEVNSLGEVDSQDLAPDYRFPKHKLSVESEPERLSNADGHRRLSRSKHVQRRLSAMTSPRASVVAEFTPALEQSSQATDRELEPRRTRRKSTLGSPRASAIPYLTPTLEQSTSATERVREPRRVRASVAGPSSTPTEVVAVTSPPSDHVDAIVQQAGPEITVLDPSPPSRDQLDVQPETRRISSRDLRPTTAPARTPAYSQPEPLPTQVRKSHLPELPRRSSSPPAPPSRPLPTRPISTSTPSPHISTSPAPAFQKPAAKLPPTPSHAATLPARPRTQDSFLTQGHASSLLSSPSSVHSAPACNPSTVRPLPTPSTSKLSHSHSHDHPPVHIPFHTTQLQSAVDHEPALSRLPDATQLARAARMHVVKENGVRVPFGDLWKTQRTVVVFIRHFWCPWCQDYLSSIMRDVSQAALQRSGVNVVVIGCGSYALIKSYRQIFHFPFQLYTDASNGQALYRTLGMGIVSSVARQRGVREEKGSYIKHGAVSGLAMVVRNALKVGMPVWERGGDVGQLGGEFVLGPGLSCVYAHRMQNPRTHAPILDVLAAAGVNHPARTVSRNISLPLEREDLAHDLRQVDDGQLRRNEKMLSVVNEENLCGFACGIEKGAIGHHLGIAGSTVSIDWDSNASGESGVVVLGRTHG